MWLYIKFQAAALCHCQWTWVQSLSFQPTFLLLVDFKLILSMLCELRLQRHSLLKLHAAGSPSLLTAATGTEPLLMPSMTQSLTSLSDIPIYTPPTGLPLPFALTFLQ